MKPHITFSRVTHSRRTFVLTALFLGLLVMAPAYGQESNRDRMALPLPAPLADSTRPLTTGTELIVDGDFESGYYGGSLTSDTSGVTGPWQWDNNPSFNNPINGSNSSYAHSGSWMAYFDPFGPSRSQLRQMVTIPSGVTATLSFWLRLSGAVGQCNACTGGSPQDWLAVDFTDLSGQGIGTFVHYYYDSDSAGFSWVNYTYDVSAYAGQTLYLMFSVNEVGDTVFMIDDVSLRTQSASAGNCTEDAFTMCLVNGRYKVTSHWLNQYVTPPAAANLFKSKLTDNVGAFWIADAATYEYLIRIQTGESNGKAWIAIPTFTDVEFWVLVTDTVRNQLQIYHSAPGNRTLIYDPNTFIYP
jgi:hypothetical protein